LSISHCFGIVAAPRRDSLLSDLGRFALLTRHPARSGNFGIHQSLFTHQSRNVPELSSDTVESPVLSPPGDSQVPNRIKLFSRILLSYASGPVQFPFQIRHARSDRSVTHACTACHARCTTAAMSRHVYVAFMCHECRPYMHGAFWLYSEVALDVPMMDKTHHGRL